MKNLIPNWLSEQAIEGRREQLTFASHRNVLDPQPEESNHMSRIRRGEELAMEVNQTTAPMVECECDDYRDQEIG